MLIDIHGHLLDLAFRTGKPLNASLDGNTDVPLLRQGGVTGQLCPIWTPDVVLSGPHSHSVDSPFASLLAVLDYLHKELDEPAGDDVLLALNAADFRQAEATGRVAVMAGMEGTDALGDDPEKLQLFHRLGLRHVCLVHEHINSFGAASQVWERGTMRRFDPARDPAGRLTDVGRELIAEMQRLGILIDLTHLVEPAFWNVLEIVHGPVLVSHGGARGVTDSIRYLTDEQIRAIAATGGLIGASPSPLGPSREQPGLPLLLDTIDYLVKLVGTAHVAIGTDFKDQPGYYPPGFANSGETSGLIRGLEQRGYNQTSIDDICGENFVRIVEQVLA
ncbi:MAG: membrane dipeptidase [Planctomycetaceae bacterium]